MRKLTRCLISSIMIIVVLSSILVISASAATTTTFTVSFYANGGTGSMPSINVTYGNPVSLPLNTFTRSGYHFIGWFAYRQSDGKWLYKNNTTSEQRWLTEAQASAYGNYSKVLYPDGHTISKTSSVNNDIVRMYAQWQANTYTVSFIANGGSGYMSSIQVTYGINTTLPANTFTRTEYTFKGWYAYRQSDGKWLYKNNTTSEQRWLTEAQASAYGNYSKVLYPDQHTISKTTPVNNDTVKMYAQWQRKVYSLVRNNAGNEILTTIGMNDHGWTTFSIYYSYTENYTRTTTQATFKHRELYVTVESSRPDWDTPYNFSCGPLRHVNSSGNTLTTFSMTDTDAMFPQVWACYDKINNTSVTYSRTSNNKGQFTLTITGTNCINPYGNTFNFSLNV